MDAWLVKLDGTGDMEWNLTYGGPGDDRANDMCKTTDGGYLLGGVTGSSGAGNLDFWLIKVNATGAMQWNKTYGGPNTDQGYWVVQTNDGGYALIGLTNSSGAGGTDTWLVKTDASGNMLWNKTYGGTGEDWDLCMIQANDGGYAISGYTTSFGAGGQDAWFVKTDSNGNMLWNKTYGGTGTDVLYTIVQTSDGGYTLGGRTNSFGAGGSDAWLVKTDSNGNILWNKTYGGASSEYGLHMIQTSEGGYAIAGFTISFATGLPGAYDAWLVKTDASGNMQWHKAFGGPRNEIVWSFLQANDGAFVLACNTQSYGAGTLTDTDWYIVKTNVEQGLTQVNSTTNSLTLYRGATDSYWNYVRVRIWKTT